MKRSLALLAVVTVLWVLFSTWYYDCTIKGVCGPERVVRVASPVPAAVPVATTAVSEPGQPATADAEPVESSMAAGTLETPAVQIPSAPSGPPDVLIVAFDARSAAVVPPADVEAKLELLREGVAAGKKILVRGHSDGRGARERIAVVSRQRAEGLRDWLLTQGFAADAIAGVESREDRDPIANNGQAEGRAKNRRAEALLVPSK